MLFIAANQQLVHIFFAIDAFWIIKFYPLFYNTFPATNIMTTRINCIIVYRFTAYQTIFFCFNPINFLVVIIPFTFYYFSMTSTHSLPSSRNTKTRGRNFFLRNLFFFLNICWVYIIILFAFLSLKLIVVQISIVP